MHTQPALVSPDQSAPKFSISDEAARRILGLHTAEGSPPAMLRLYVKGGGCSGLSYGFELDTLRAADDWAVEKHGATLLVDPISAQYLVGAELDYQENLSGAAFIIRNPNAKTSCGCGSSFST